MKTLRRIIFMVAVAAMSLAAMAQGDARKAQSRMVTDSIKSKVLGEWVPYNVYLPKSFEVDADRKYPILYLLHGMSDDNFCWANKANLKGVADQLIASGEADEMIIVTPKAGGEVNVEWNGYFNMEGWNYDDFFFTEFMPAIEKQYRVIGDRQHRAIAGLSMGGGGCASYAQHHPELFCCAYPMSAFLTIIGRDIKNTDKTDKISKYYKSAIERDCVDFINNADDKTKDDLRSIAWFVDCGDDDFLLDGNIAFVQTMRGAKIPLEFRVRDGGHTWEYWHSALYTCLPWVTRNFKK